MPTCEQQWLEFDGSVAYWGGSRLHVDGEPFDAMRDAHCDYALREAEDRVGPISVLKVGFWNPNDPDAGDPNEVVIDFTDAVAGTEGFERVGDQSVRATRKSNIGVIRNQRGLANFGFRVADSHWGLLVIQDFATAFYTVFFLHLGRDCIMPLRPGGKSVFETARDWCKKNEIEMSDVTLHTSGGIQKCCYKFPNVDQIKKRVIDRYGPDSVEDAFEDGGTSAEISFDLEYLIWWEFRRALPDEHAQSTVCMGSHCTACYGHDARKDPSKRLLYSSARGDGSKRNLCVVSHYINEVDD